MTEIENMTAISEEELAANFDDILARAEAGESFVINKGGPGAVVLVPYHDPVAQAALRSSK